MEITSKHIWMAGILIWFLALAAAKIWPSEQSYGDWEREYTEQLMYLHSGIPLDSIKKK